MVEVAGDQRLVVGGENAMQRRVVGMAAATIASLTAFTVVGFWATNLKSISETLGVGTRIERAVELARQLRQDEADGLGRARWWSGSSTARRRGAR